MDQRFSKILTKLGFEQRIETLFSLVMEDELYSTSNKWEVFAYFEDGKYYFSDNGDMVEMFDAPDIDTLALVEDIKVSIVKYGCRLDVSKIVKEIDLNNIEKDLENFILAIHCVDEIYKSL